MADNVAITAGSGTTIATEDEGGVHYQKIKLVDGDTGTTTAVKVDIGVKANALRVAPASDITDATYIGDIKFGESLPAGNANIGDVDVLTLPAVTGTGTFAVQVDGAALTALQLIDDTVAVLGTDTYTEATTKGLIIAGVRRDADTTLVNTTNEVSPLHVDANGRLKVEAFSGETLPVSLTSTTVTGTVAVTQSGTWDEVGINDSGNSITVDNGGTFAVQADAVVPGSGATNLGKAEDAAHTSGDVGVFALGVRVDTPNTALTNTDADYSPVAVNKLGSVRLAPPEDDFAVAGSNHVKKYYTNAGAVTDGIIWSPAAGKRWYITSFFVNVSAAATVTLEDDKAGGDEVIWKAELAANSGWSASFPVPWFSGEDAADLMVTTSAGNVYITAVGYEI